MKFQVDSFYSLEVMAWTKIQSENWQKGRIQMLSVAEFLWLHFYIMYSISARSLHLIASIVWKLWPTEKFEVRSFQQTRGSRWPWITHQLLSEKNLLEFLYVWTVQVAPFTNAMLTDRSKFLEKFLKRVTQGTVW